MSALSGIGVKGEKGKGKYKSLNINTIYKGTSVAPQKASGSITKHGLQSLGKVATTRRMPPPAHLPSLRSEHSGNDPTINLVPSGSGWVSSDEKPTGTPTSSSTSSSNSAATPPATASQAQKGASAPVTTTGKQPSSQSTAGEYGGRQHLLQPQQGTQQSQGHKATTMTTSQQQQQTTQQGANNNNSQGGGGKPSWSSVTSGGPRNQGDLIDQKSPFFQEEFPTLASGGGGEAERSPPPQQLKDESRESQYGPGPSLRPQNVGSWKEGGGRGAIQQDDPEDQQQQSRNGTSSGMDSKQDTSPPQSPPASSGMNSSPMGSAMPPHSSSMGPRMRPPPHGMNPMMYRGMVPPYMYGHGGFPGPFGPNFRPGMAGPGGPSGPRPPYQYGQGDPHMRGNVPPRHMNEKVSSTHGQTSIVKDQDLKEFDHLLKNESSDGGWADAQGDVDYSEQLVFSDDEDPTPKKKDHHPEQRRDERNARSPRVPREEDQGRGKERYDDHNEKRGFDRRERTDSRGDRSSREREWTVEKDRNWERSERERNSAERSYPGKMSDRDRVFDRNMVSERDPNMMYGGPKEAWMPAGPQGPQGHFNRPPMEHPYHRMPFDHRPPMGYGPQFRMPHGQHPHGPMMPPGRRASPGSAPMPSGTQQSPQSYPEADDDESLQAKRKQCDEDVHAAVERARQLREEGEKRMEEQRRDKQRSFDDVKDELEVDKPRSRTTSESSVDRGDRYHSREKFNQSSHANKNSRLPPRFQKKQSENLRNQGSPDGGGASSPKSAGADRVLEERRGGPMPPQQQQQQQASPQGQRFGPQGPWPNDPRAWAAMGGPGVPGFMDRRMGNRPPMDMPAGLVMHSHPLRRSLSESGDEGRVDERGLEKPFTDFHDMRGWERYPPMPAGWDEHMRRSGHPPGAAPYYYHPDMDRRGPQMESPGDNFEDRSGDYSESHREDQERWEHRSRGEKEGTSKDPKVREKEAESKDSFEEEQHIEKAESRRDRYERSESHEKVHSDKPEKEIESKKKEEHKRSDDQPRSRDGRKNRGRHDRDDKHKGKGGKEHKWASSFDSEQDFPSGRGMHGEHGGKRQGHHYPTPIPHQTAQQNAPHRSNYTSLKRSHSTLSSDGQKVDSAAVKEEKKALSRESLHKLGRSGSKESVKSSDSRDGRRNRDARASDKLSENEGKKAWSEPSINEDSAAASVAPAPKPTRREEQQHKERSRAEAKEEKENGKKEDQPPPANVWSNRGTNTRESKKELVEISDWAGEESRPPPKKPRDDERGSNRGRGRGRSDDRSGRGAGADRGKSREYVRGGRANRSRSDRSVGYTNNNQRGQPAPRLSQGSRDSARDSGRDSGRDSTRESGSRGGRSGNPWIKDDEPTVSLNTAVAGSKPESETDSLPAVVVPKDEASASATAASVIEAASPEENAQGESPKDSEVKERKDSRGPSQRTSRDEKDFKKPDGDARKQERFNRRELSNRERSEGGRGRGQRSSGRGDGSREPRKGRGGSSSRGRGRGRGEHDGPGSRYHSAPSRGQDGSEQPPMSNSRGAHGRRDNFEDDWNDEYRNDQRSDSRRWKSEQRSHQPPRFAAARGGRGTGAAGVGAGGGSGPSEGGRGRGRGIRGPRTNSTSSASRPPKTKPPLTKQNSSDIGNEEWETASESSDVLEKKELKNEANKENRDRSSEVPNGGPRSEGAKKSFTRQRPSNDRQNRRSNESRSSSERQNKERSPNSTKVNGAGHVGPPAGRGAGRSGGRGPSTATVFRMDQVLANDPTAIQNAINSLASKSKAPKKSELTDISMTSAKASKSQADKEKDKKAEALANIDINNYAGVVVIDDQPEVSIDDPAFLFESNEGFQEVTSRKTLKSKQKDALRQIKDSEQLQALLMQQAKLQGKKKDKEGKTKRVVSDKRLSKLPPRLAKARELKEREKQQQKAAAAAAAVQQSVSPSQLAASIPHPSPPQMSQAPVSDDILPKIENWNNDMADNIPAHEAEAAAAKKEFAGNMAPAPAPVVNAWDTPLAVTAPPALNADSKFNDKGDQHDSGIDVSENMNSADSSTRNSPSADSKLKSSEDILSKISEANSEDGSIDLDAKPQRKGREAKIIKPTDTKPAKKHDTTKQGKGSAGLGAIQLPPSFKEAFNFNKQGDEISELKLDFTFDAELAKLTEEKSEVSKDDEDEAPKSPSIPMVDASHITSPTSSATDDLGLKIAAVKTVWDSLSPMAPVFEHMDHKMTSAGQSGVTQSMVTSSPAESTSINAPSSSAAGFSSFSSVDDDTAAVAAASVDVSMAMETSTPSDFPELTNALVASPSQQMNYCDSSAASVVADMTDNVHDVVSSIARSLASGSVVEMTDQPNVCKVKPQQLQQQQQQSPQLQASSSAVLMVPSSPVTNLPSNSMSQQHQHQPLHHSSMPSPPAQVPNTAPHMLFAAQTMVSQYHPFPVQQSSIMTHDSRYAHQAPGFGFNLSGQNASNAAGPMAAFTQPSLFLQPSGQHNPAASDLYSSGPNTNALPPYRATQYNPPQQQTQANQQSNSQKSNPLAAALPYGPLIGNTSLQPSQLFVPYDPSQSAAPGNHAAPGGPPSQNTSQIIGSQLMSQQRATVQSMQTAQSSFFHNQSPLQQTGFFQAQQTSTGLQAPMQQQQQVAPTQYSMQSYGQTQSLPGLPMQPLSVPNSQLNKSAAPFKPASQQQQSSSMASSASPNTSQYKSSHAFGMSSASSSVFHPSGGPSSLSSNHYSTSNSSGLLTTGAGSMSSGNAAVNSKQYQQQMQLQKALQVTGVNTSCSNSVDMSGAGGLMGSLNFNQKPKPPNQQPGYNRSNSLQGQQAGAGLSNAQPQPNWQSNTGAQNKGSGNSNMSYNNAAAMQASILQAQLLMRGNAAAAAALGIRPPGPNSNVFNPLQQQQQQPQQPPPLNVMFGGNQQQSANRNSRAGPPPSEVPRSSASIPVSASPFMDQKAKQRAEVLQQAKAFLNPTKVAAAAAAAASSSSSSPPVTVITKAEPIIATGPVTTSTVAAPATVTTVTDIVESEAASEPAIVAAAAAAAVVINTDKPTKEEKDCMNAETKNEESSSSTSSN